VQWLSRRRLDARDLGAAQVAARSRSRDRYDATMALLYKADLTPSKLELLASWLPGRAWHHGPAGVAIERVAACRFDDPAGKVGVETILVRTADGPIYHTPLTYREAPLAGGEAWLLGTSEHSVLGTRWVYDACGDPVYAAALAAAIFTGGHEAEEFIQAEDGQRQRRAPAMTVRGSGVPDASVPAVTAIRSVADGDPARVVTDAVELAVVRVVEVQRQGGGAMLTASWPGQETPVLLAYEVAA